MQECSWIKNTGLKWLVKLWLGTPDCLCYFSLSNQLVRHPSHIVDGCIFPVLCGDRRGFHSGSDCWHPGVCLHGPREGEPPQVHAGRHGYVPG